MRQNHNPEIGRVRNTGKTHGGRKQKEQMAGMSVVVDEQHEL